MKKTEKVKKEGFSEKMFKILQRENKTGGEI